MCAASRHEIARLATRPWDLTPELAREGRVFGDAEALALAKAYPDATDWHRRHPNV